MRIIETVVTSVRVFEMHYPKSGSWTGRSAGFWGAGQDATTGNGCSIPEELQRSHVPQKRAILRGSELTIKMNVNCLKKSI